MSLGRPEKRMRVLCIKPTKLSAFSMFTSIVMAAGFG